MTNGAIAVTAAASELVAADTDRGQVVLQYVSGSPTYLAFGTDVPVVGSGLILSADFPLVVVEGDYQATQAINGICDTALTAVGTYTTDPDVTIAAGGEGSSAAATVTALEALLLRMTPPVPAPQAAATETTDAWNELFTIPANCVFARVTGSNGFYAMAGMTTVDPAQDGNDYKPNIAYDIPCGGANNRLFVKNVTGGGGSDAVITCTFYCTA